MALSRRARFHSEQAQAARDRAIAKAAAEAVTAEVHSHRVADDRITSATAAARQSARLLAEADCPVSAASCLAAMAREIMPAEPMKPALAAAEAMFKPGRAA